MKNNLSLAGSEIINESKSKINNYSIISSTSPNKDQKVIIKSYKITDAQSPVSNNISSKNKENSKEKKILQTKKLNSLDLSKIKYNDGYILTDAANSNPGFGLWALKTKSKDNEKNIKKYNLDTDRKSINTIPSNKNNIANNSNINKIINTTNNITTNKNIDKSQSITFTNSKNDETKNLIKLLVENLKMKCNDLETKCTNFLSNLEQKIYMCNNSIKLKREYEKILQDNIKDTQLIKEKVSSLSIENAKLNNVYKNIENELNRLLNVMKTDKENMEKLKEEFNSRLIEEDNERKRLNIILQDAKEKVKSLEEELDQKTKENKEENIKNNNKRTSIINIDIIEKKESTSKKEFEDENLNEMILELELKICNMKKKINNQEEENNKLKKILRFKEEKNGIEKNQLTNLNFLLQFQKENQKNDLNIVSKQDALIKQLKNKYHFKTNKNNKISNSVSLKKINDI